MVVSEVPRKKFPVTPPGIDAGTVRLVAQRLNHYAAPGPTCLLRVIITSSLYLTHHPANLFYELDTWKPSSSLVIQGIPYSLLNRTTTYHVRQNPPQMAIINPINSLPSYFCKKSIFFIYLQFSQRNCISYFYNTCYIPCQSPLPYFDRSFNNWRTANSRVLFFMEHCSVNLFLHLIGVRPSSLVPCL